MSNAECGSENEHPNPEPPAPASKLCITDFGLAHIESDATLTMTGDLLGTLRYMSPEQAEGKSAILDHRTDIYSLGITLYELLTLQPAFPATDRQTLLRQIANDEPPAPRKLNHTIPADLETIVLKSISKDPRDRYASAADLAADLYRYIAQQPLKARRPRADRPQPSLDRPPCGPVSRHGYAPHRRRRRNSAAVLSVKAYHAESVEHARAEADLASLLTRSTR